MTKTFDAKKLEDFLVKPDRIINPFFTGRENLLFRIEIKSKIVSNNHQEKYMDASAEGMTQVIQGPPGVGKTSVLKKIRMNCIEQLNDEKERYKTIPVMINESKSLSLDYIRKRIHDTIDELVTDISVDGVKDMIRTSLGAVSSVSALGVGISINQSNKPKPMVPPNYTVMLLIDEVQTIPGDEHSDAAKALLRLHSGSNGYPILPVLAGLANSRIVLQQVGISRFEEGAVQNLQPLSPPEVKESLGKFVDYFNVRTIPEITSDWGDRIGGWVDGWPKHLENTMVRALGRELLKTDGNLAAVDPHTVKRNAALIRADYYNTRFGPFYSTPRIIGEIMADIGPIPREGEEIRTIINKTLKKPQWAELVSDPDLPRLNFNFLLHYGLINHIDSPTIHRFKCPIPSLQSFSVASTGSPLHTSAYAGLDDEIKACLSDGYDINGIDAWRRTPLHIAAENNWDKVTSLLLKKGADPHLRDHRNRLPQDLAKKGSYTQKLIISVCPRMI